METLGSNWDGLHPSLIAHFRPVDYDGNVVPNENEVICPLLQDGSLALEQNWQSPFEQMGPESKAPAISAMLQSGAVLPLVNAFKDGLSSLSSGQNADTLFGLAAGALVAGVNRALQAVSSSVNDLRGKTGITRINSTQVFSGMAPVKLNISLYFRAWKDPVAEVMQPISQLMQWAVPQWLAPDGVIVGALAGTNGAGGSILNSLLPSKAPMLLSFTYGNQSFQKMVIETMEVPITAPRDKNGNWTEAVVPISIASLTALDRQDIVNYFAGKG